MNLHCLQHVSFEGPAAIADWAAAKGHSIGCTHLYRGDKLPDLAAVDWLVVMGGPMNIYEHRNHPWLREEKRFLEVAIARGKTILGVCLGAQLLADVLGAKVYQNDEREIGWFPVEIIPSPEAERLLTLAGRATTVLHWHGDTFDLPKGAIHLAQSAGCHNQAFVAERRLVGLQFHLEQTQAGIASMIEHCPGDFVPGKFVQSPQQILANPSQPDSVHPILRGLLDAMQKSVN